MKIYMVFDVSELIDIFSFACATLEEAQSECQREIDEDCCSAYDIYEYDLSLPRRKRLPYDPVCRMAGVMPQRPDDEL